MITAWLVVRKKGFTRAWPSGNARLKRGQVGHFAVKCDAPMPPMHKLPMSSLSSAITSSGRERKEMKRFSDEQESYMLKGKNKESAAASKLKAAEARLTEGSELERCLAVLDVMALRSDAKFFRNPVPVAAVPDYLDVIAEPTDYATVRAKLSEGQFEGYIEFAAEMRRIFTNAVQYNWKPDHHIHIAARACLRAFEQTLGRARGIEPLDEGGGGGAASAKQKLKRKSEGGGGARAPQPPTTRTDSASPQPATGARDR